MLLLLFKCKNLWWKVVLSLTRNWLGIFWFLIHLYCSFIVLVFLNVINLHSKHNIGIDAQTTDCLWNHSGIGTEHLRFHLFLGLQTIQMHLSIKLSLRFLLSLVIYIISLIEDEWLFHASSLLIFFFCLDYSISFNRTLLFSCLLYFLIEKLC